MKVLIVEDEVAAASRLSKMLVRVAPKAEIVGVTESIESTVNWLKTHNEPNLILLDIHLADGSSFEIFKQVHVSSPIIFITAYDEYALQAFKLKSIDYLLKPIKHDELANAILKYTDIFETKIAVDYSQLLKLFSGNLNTTYRQRFLVNYADKLRAVEVCDVAYFVAQEKGVFLVTSDGKNFAIDSTLERLEREVDSNFFFRINRKFLIQFKSIKAMHSYSKSRVKLELIPNSLIEAIVSSERASEFKQWLNR